MITSGVRAICLRTRVFVLHVYSQIINVRNHTGICPGQPRMQRALGNAQCLCGLLYGQALRLPAFPPETGQPDLAPGRSRPVRRPRSGANRRLRHFLLSLYFTTRRTCLQASFVSELEIVSQLHDLGHFFGLAFQFRIFVKIERQSVRPGDKRARPQRVNHLHLQRFIVLRLSQNRVARIGPSKTRMSRQITPRALDQFRTLPTRLCPVHLKPKLRKDSNWLFFLNRYRFGTSPASHFDAKLLP